jgi:hypothetical protein
MPQATNEVAPLALDACGATLTSALSSEPQTDQQNQDKRGQNKPRDHDDFDPNVANRWDVVVDLRLF